MIDRQRILFLTNRLPYPPDKGEKIRTYHQLRHLAAWHDVYCACFVDRPEDWRHVDEVRRLCRNLIAIPWRKARAAIRALLGAACGGSLTASAFRSRRMRAELARLSRDVASPFDAVVAFSSTMAGYALAVPAARRVLDLCDADSEKWFDYARRCRPPAGWFYKSEGRRLQRSEQRALDAFDATIVITERERAALCRLDERTDRPDLLTIPNGVRLLDDKDRRPWERGPVVGFIGSMNYPPNADGACWFAETVWPSVVHRMPQARLLIVGRNPSRRVQLLGRLPGVVVTGEVADARAFLLQCRAIVAPLRMSRGLPNKILEAMAAARPIVATSAAVSALTVTCPKNVLIADEPRSFARCVLALLDSDALCRGVGEAGYRFAAIHYCWPDVLQRYERAVLGEAPPPSRAVPGRTLIHAPRRRRGSPEPVPQPASA